MRYLFALVMCAMLSTCGVAPAFAADCIPLDVAIHRLESTSIAAEVYVASESETAKAVAIINAMPPETDEHFDVIILVTTKNGSGALFFGDDGKVCGHVEIAEDGWRNFVKAVRGSGT